MIHCDRLNNELVFSDDQALLPEGINEYIQDWLVLPKPAPSVYFREPLQFDQYYSGDLAELTVKTYCFNLVHWQMDNMARVFRCTEDSEHKYQILGPEVDPKTGEVIAPSPVTEVVIRQSDQPPASMQAQARLAAEVWATLTDAERERCPKIGQVADLLDLDALL